MTALGLLVASRRASPLSVQQPKDPDGKTGASEDGSGHPLEQAGLKSGDLGTHGAMDGSDFSAHLGDLAAHGSALTADVGSQGFEILAGSRGRRARRPAGPRW